MKTIQKVNITLIFSIIFLFILNANAQDNGQWEILNEGGDFISIGFVNDEVGWIVYVGALLKTEDGGNTWQSLPIDSEC